MDQKKSTLISCLVQLGVAAVVVVLIYSLLSGRLDVNTSAHRAYRDVPQAWPVRCWSDALFIPGVLWLGMGGLMWVASTDFFDIFRYAFSSLLGLFSPLKGPREHKRFYEYKLERDEKRREKARGIPVTILMMGVALMIGAMALSFVHEGMVAPWYEAHPATYSTYAAPTDETEDAEVADEESGDATDTTGGENHE